LQEGNSDFRCINIYQSGIFDVIKNRDIHFENVFVSIKYNLSIYSSGEKIKKIKICMNRIFLRLSFSFALLIISISAFSQIRTERSLSGNEVMDSLKKSGVIFNDDYKKPEILLSKDQAVIFLREKIRTRNWIDLHNPLRMALSQLIYEASHQRFDSAEYFLKQYAYDSLNIPWTKFYVWEPVRLKIPVISHTESHNIADSVVRADTGIVHAAGDSTGIAALIIRKPGVEAQQAKLKDTSIMVVVDTLHKVTSSISSFPFRYSDFPFQGDSISVAVESLLKYLEERDSTVISFTGIGKKAVPVWINSKSGTMVRYWLKNEFADSVTVWIGNRSRDTIGLYLEQGVTFKRPVRQSDYSKAKIDIKSLDNSKLLSIQEIAVKPQYWKYRSEASFVLSQSAVSNWTRGGENSISSLVDITGYADYNNKALKLSSNNFVRLKLGFLKSGSEPLRKNIDLLETNSKLNHTAFGKFDFSGILLLKTQTSPGYNYTTFNNRDTAILVSKFMNPAILIVGLGLDYKPNKLTSINFSPLSYKGTFVPDTVHIDQTKYGIAKDRRSLNEPGVSFMINHEFRPIKNLTITNRLQLFTNYIHNPRNIDVDWEMIAVANLNWFTDVRFNIHLIYDDDAKTAVLDKNKQPILGPDGLQKKAARVQFKEILGLSLVFRF
jgi:hypothetical protein